MHTKGNTENPFVSGPILRQLLRFMVLVILALDCLVGCTALTMIGYFNGSGHSTFVMIQGLIGAFLVRIPIVLLLSRWQGVTLFHIGLGGAMATVTTLVLSIIFYLVKGRHIGNSV